MTTERSVPVLSPPWAARGRSTSMDARTMYVAVTMKMMRRTRTTSTRGVTLISLMRSSSSPPFVPATSRPFAGPRLEVRDRGVAERGGALGGATEAALEEVVGDDRGQRDEEANGGRDERLADADHHRAGATRGGVPREVEEGADHPEHRPEQPDEGGVVPERAEEREAALVLDPAALDRRGDDLADRPRPLGGVLGDRADDGGLEPLAPAHRGRRAGEVAGEEPPLYVVAALEPAREEERRALDHHADGEDREDDEQPQH